MSTQKAGVALNLTIGQRVRHHDHKGQRVTGIVRSLGIEDGRLMAGIGLDAPIVIPARSDDDREIRIYNQHVCAVELAPFDDRDELIEELSGALAQMLNHAKGADQGLLDAGYAAIAKVKALTPDAPRRKAPWPDFYGQDIHEGDVLEHPAGQRGAVIYDETRGDDEYGRWRVKYGDDPVTSALGLQIGHKGMGMVVSKAS